MTRGATPPAWLACLACAAVFTGGCGDNEAEPASSNAGAAPTSATKSATAEDPNGVVKIDGGRGLYMRCSGSGSPTVVMEGGDGDTSDSYAFAEAKVANVTRACVYDRAALGKATPLRARAVSRTWSTTSRPCSAPPMSRVRSSWWAHPEAATSPPATPWSTRGQTAGMVFVDVGAPSAIHPRRSSRRPGHPENLEQRDYLQVEKDAWDARERIGDIPVKVISTRLGGSDRSRHSRPSASACDERRAAEGWLVLSPRAEQIVVTAATPSRRRIPNS